MTQSPIDHIAGIITAAIPCDIRVRIEADGQPDVVLHLEDRDGRRFVVSIQEAR